MKVRSLIASTLSAAVLSACADSSAPPPPKLDAEAPYTDLPARRVPVSGVVFDPEAMFYTFVMWPPDPEDPDAGPPLPALLYGMPTVMRASVWGAQVSMVGPTGEVVDTSGPAMPPWGNFQTEGIPSDPTVPYLMRAEPAPGLSVGAADMFPEEEGHAPIPAVPYYATTSLRPIAATGTQCLIQSPAIVGEAGALGALAQVISEETGTSVSPASRRMPRRAARWRCCGSTRPARCWTRSCSPAVTSRRRRRRARCTPSTGRRRARSRARRRWATSRFPTA
ncbi:hypothetical protein QEG98_09100 [Myxococcus sp. MxC21-1]|uniref:hypothetical protein n=1 Tax=Myxococcus sp. MxC21-1 TaxID=3041439 RepID=UPI002931B6A2|nr:hypothetical protein [Myxococcus sp. MxC21-1]WNZ63828.1 hypothetical protein QEG98_09100 [Myxococcus sp. MxC21-1]